MNHLDRDRRIQDLFVQALDLFVDERYAFLDRECRDDGDLRDAVAGLLRNLERAEDKGFLVSGRAATGTWSDARPHGHHLNCPHCHAPIEIVTPASTAEISCPSCGSRFTLRESSTVTWRTKRRDFGRFTQLQWIGEGAHGSVFKARDPQLDRVVALKIPRAGDLLTPDDRARFFREARNVAQLSHSTITGIVPVHEVGEYEGIPYILSDFIDGQTLDDRLSDPLDRPGFRESAVLVSQIADALHEAHGHGVIHRDVKPSNILIDRATGRPLLADFGLAKREAGEVTIALSGDVLGTPAYMSPEQASGSSHQADARSDVYSLGVVIYRMLSGELPFRGTHRRLLDQIQNDEPKPPRSLNDRIPRDLETICLKAMAKEPDRRYATARDLAEDLRRFLNNETIRGRPEGRVQRVWRWCRRNPNMALLVASFIAALVIGSAMSMFFAIRANRMAADARRQRDLAIGTLRELKVLTAEWAYEVGWNAFRSGSWTLNRLCQVSKYILESRHDPNDKETDPLPFDGHVDRMKEVEAHVTAESKMGRAVGEELLEARFFRVEAEYLRARALAGPPGALGTATILLATAKEAYGAQATSFEEGRITLHRLTDMSKAVMELQQVLATMDADRLAALDGHLERMKEVEVREKAMLEVGRSSIVDALEARYFRVEAEYLRARDMAGPSASRTLGLAEARIRAANETLEAQVRFYEEGRITLDRPLSMSKALMESQRDVATKGEDRLSAIVGHLGRMKSFEIREKSELEVGRGMKADTGEARYFRLEAEYMLARAISGGSW